jgi:hypothetical protein
MKKLTLTLLASLAVAATSFGGHEMVSKEYKAPLPEPCFRAGEFQLDVFGSYNGAITNEEFGDGFGGGIGINYFFTEMIGIGISGNVYQGITPSTAIAPFGTVAATSSSAFRSKARFALLPTSSVAVASVRTARPLAHGKPVAVSSGV